MTEDWRAEWKSLIKLARTRYPIYTDGRYGEAILAADVALKAAERERDDLLAQLAGLNRTTAYTGSVTATAPLEPTVQWVQLKSPTAVPKEGTGEDDR